MTKRPVQQAQLFHLGDQTLFANNVDTFRHTWRRAGYRSRAQRIAS
jgi:hypothetical protein